MADQEKKSLGVGGRTGRFRTLLFFIVVFIILVGILSYAYYARQIKGGGLVTSAELSKIPKVGSIPGEETSQEYAKALQQENIQQAKLAAETGKSAIPTISRAAFTGSSEFEEGTAPKAGCTNADLAKAREAGVKADELKCRGCTAKQLRSAGYTAGELAAAGFSASDLRAAGFSVEELKAAGFSAAELKAAGYRADELARAGYTASELAQAGYTKEQLEAAGFTPEQVAIALAGVGTKLKDADCTREGIIKARQAGASAADLKKCGAQALRSAGFTAQQLKDAGFSAAELKAAGFTAADLKAAGYSAGELRAAGYTAADLKAAGFTPAQLRQAGYTAEQLRSAGFTPTELRTAGYTDGDLVRAGFTKEELAKIACSPESLAQARAQNISPAALAAKGCQAEELLAAGYTKAELAAAGVGPKVGCSPEFLAQALKDKVSTSLLVKLGCTIEQMVAAGYTPAEINDPCGIEALKKGKERGLSPEQMKAHGCTEAQLQAAGLPASSQEALLKTTEQSRLDELEKRREAKLNADERREALERTRQAMENTATSLFETWTPPSTQVLVVGQSPEERAAQLKKMGGPPPSSVSVVKGGPGGPGCCGPGKGGKPTTIKAGTVMYGTIDTGINSDEQSPILATIVSGPLKGGKLIGRFTTVGEKVRIDFNTLNAPQFENSFPLTAVAIDTETARTAIASDVDRHMLLRYGTLFASSFLAGLADAISSSGSQESSGAGGLIVTHDTLSAGEKLGVALGRVGTEYASYLGSTFTTPPTITVNAGTAIGILFMSDVTLPGRV